MASSDGAAIDFGHEGCRGDALQELSDQDVFAGCCSDFWSRIQDNEVEVCVREEEVGVGAVEDDDLGRRCGPILWLEGVQEVVQIRHETGVDEVDWGIVKCDAGDISARFERKRTISGRSRCSFHFCYDRFSCDGQ